MQWGGTPLYWAARLGQLEFVQLLLRHGADKELKAKYGSQPVDLNWVCCWDNKQHKAAITALLR